MPARQNPIRPEATKAEAHQDAVLAEGTTVSQNQRRPADPAVRINAAELLRRHQRTPLITNRAATVPASEVAELLLQIVAREITVKAKGQTWNDVQIGDVTFSLSNGAELVVFNDCSDLDYIDAIRMPDGRTCQFEDWVPTDEELGDSYSDGNPLNLLIWEWQKGLEMILEAAEIGWTEPERVR
jgi:hypothetical protein